MPLELTTLARVKAFANADSVAWSAGVETLATQLIRSVSRAIERHLGRELKAEARTIDLDVEPGRSLLWLPAYPVSAVASVKLDASREFASSSIVAATAYVVDGRLGAVRFLSPPGVYGPLAARVTYTGGIAADAAAVVADGSEYLDLAEACELQVLYEVRRRDNPGGTSTQGGGGSTTFEGALKLLTRVLELLAPHRRVFCG